MGKPIRRYLIVQVILTCVVAVSACTVMGTVGGMALGMAPEFTFGLVGGLVCPEGTLEYYPVYRGYHEPGESEPHVECLSPDGEREDVLLLAVGVVLGLTFAVAFVVLWVPLSVIGWLVTRRSVSATGMTNTVN